MRISTLITPAILLAMLAAPGCTEDEPAPNEPGAFGDPCVIGEDDNTPDGCLGGHYCYLGVCMEDCTMPSDCQPLEGWEHQCTAGFCHIRCDEEKTCPQDLNTPLICNKAGIYCKSEEYE